MPSYAIFLRTEAVDALRTMRVSPRRRLAAFIDSLVTNPLSTGDYTVRDPSEREFQIKVIGALAITFWSDHAAKEIKIMDIRPADLA